MCYINFSDSLNPKRFQGMSVTRFSLVKVHSLFAEVFGLTGQRNVFLDSVKHQECINHNGVRFQK